MRLSAIFGTGKKLVFSKIKIVMENCVSFLQFEQRSAIVQSLRFRRSVNEIDNIPFRLSSTVYVIASFRVLKYLRVIYMRQARKLLLMFRT